MIPVPKNFRASRSAGSARFTSRHRGCAASDREKSALPTDPETTPELGLSRQWMPVLVATGVAAKSGVTEAEATSPPWILNLAAGRFHSTPLTGPITGMDGSWYR